MTLAKKIIGVLLSYPEDRKGCNRTHTHITLHLRNLHTGDSRTTKRSPVVASLYAIANFLTGAVLFNNKHYLRIRGDDGES